MANTTRNVNLDEVPLPASLYNVLPHIDAIKEATAVNAEAHAILLGLIPSHGLSQHFSIHLIHKPFDLPDERVMVYETINGPNHPEFVLCSPRKPAGCLELRGLYFQARPGGKMAAYEYTTVAGEGLSAHTNFVAKTHEDGKDGQWQELLLEGEPLAPDSELFAIISRAREMTKVF